MPDSLSRQLRQKLQPGAGLLMPGAGNALTARLIEEAGHDLFIVSGAAVSNTFLGVPDLGILSLAELAGHTSAMRDAVNIPMVVDGDTGFGNAINVGHTVRVLERAGANAIMLEDQTFPKRCGHFDNQTVISKEEMVQKIKAAVDARKDPDMMILARTDARSAEGLPQAIDRARAYQEAGADFLFIEATRDLDEMKTVPREVPGIHVCNLVIGGKTPVLHREELGRMGYAVIAYANAALQASLLAQQLVLAHLKKEGTIAGFEDRLMMFKDRQKVVQGDRFKEMALRYATAPAS